MATWVPDPPVGVQAANGGLNGVSYPFATGPTLPSAQNSPATGQPNWIGAPHASEFQNLTYGNTI